jgi:hypothetical protein
MPTNNFVGMDELSSISLDAVKRFARNILIICVGAFPSVVLFKQSARLIGYEHTNNTR